MYFGKAMPYHSVPNDKINTTNVLSLGDTIEFLICSGNYAGEKLITSCVKFAIRACSAHNGTDPVIREYFQDDGLIYIIFRDLPRR